MRFNILSAIALFFAVALTGCDDEILYPEQNGEEANGPSLLRFNVTPYTTTSGGSRASEPSPTPEPERPEECQIRDFWLFQFRPDGSKIAAKYYKIPDDGATLEALCNKAYNDLTKDTPMNLYAVTNIGDAAWGNSFTTLAQVKEASLPSASSYPIQAGVDNLQDGKPDDIYIPMSGGVGVSGSERFIEVPVTRAYAKIKIQAGFPDGTMSLYYANVEGIPWYCRVSANYPNEPNDPGEHDSMDAVAFPNGTQMISRAFNSKQVVEDADGTKWLVLYMPENVRGEVSNANKKKGENIPDNALTVTVRAKYDGEDYYYTVYPGENMKNNFSIRRNRVYRVGIDVQQIEPQHNPSSNCYVVKPGEKLQFEPYNRDEVGGGYKISTYLDPAVTAKKIARVGIIWQTKDCIGDNTNGDLVYFEANEHDPKSSKIVVKKTGEEGNALVGAYNSKGDIIWSWHIWVTPNEPDNIANAITYTTYPWDSNGIYTNRRVPGYGLMPCNIGALAFESEDDMGAYSLSNGTAFPTSQVRTFGMLYQWGRKDPFPPMIYSTGTEDSNGSLEYEDKYTGKHYANDNNTEVHKTSGYNQTNYLFHTVLGGNQTNPVQYAISHPTVYMSGNTTNSVNNAYNRKSGDWVGVDYDSDGLWGGTKGSGGYEVKDEYGYVKAHIYDNYGTKSIFDPCPKGWRVAPGDLWLGFTSTGLNPTEIKNWGGYVIGTNYELEVNYSQDKGGKRPGMYMFVQGWRTGPTVYFPLQGTRIYNGRCLNTGLCGNYHNATCDDGGRVNLLHLHRNMAIASKGYPNLLLFRLFEWKEPQYYSKSTAGPIRCVRDAK